MARRPALVEVRRRLPLHQSTLTNPQTQPRGRFTFDRNYTSSAGAAGTGDAFASFLLGYPNQLQRDFVDTYPEVLITSSASSCRTTSASPAT